MKKIVGISALIVALASGAAKPPISPPTRMRRRPRRSPSPFTWAGCYAGVNAGAIGAYAAFSGLNSTVDNRARVGAQAGCNYQFNHLVVGAEGEVAEGFWSGQRGGVSEDIALRGGYAVDRELFYGKVGAGFTDPTFGLRFPAMNLTERTTQSRAGLLLGAGVEYAIAPRWSVKAEYDYIDFGYRNVNFVGPSPRTLSVGTSRNVVSLGLNYHF